MAKLSRRAVTPSSTQASKGSSTSTGSSSGSTAPLSSSSPKHNGIPAATHGNTIAYVGKPAKYVAAATAFNDHQRGNNAATTETNDTKHFTARPTLINSVEAASPAPPHLQNKTTQAQILAAERDRIRAEFFATYDVMTGVRIAATLSGFFGLMVFLIVWKSRSSSNETMKVLKDPKMAAVAAVCMQEEEERELQEAIVATGMSIYPDEYDAIVYRRQRMLSLGNVSAPPILNRGFRFSSVGGGYSSLLEPPRRFSLSAESAAGSLGGSGRRKSGSESSRILSNFPMGSSFGNDDYFMETDDELDNATEERTAVVTLHKRSDSTKSKQGFLEVPMMGQDSRRSSAMTCCSTDSSYLERRCSAFTLGLSNLPPSLQRKLSATSRTSSTDNWDYYYPDIQVIQPTPKQSPCPSERSIYDQLQPATTTAANGSTTSIKTPATNASTSKTANPKTAGNVQKSAPSGSGRASISSGAPLPAFVRKHSIAYYDPESAQAGRKQQIHSISADTVDVYPYNQTMLHDSSAGFFGDGAKPIQSAPPASVHQGFHFTESPIEELFLNVRRKIAVVELQRPPQTQIEQVATIHHPPRNAFENNNNFPYTSSATAVKAPTAAATNSSSLSIDSTPVSIDKLNGSSSLGTVSGKALFNVEKRAPLASLSSFKISSLEYGDSEGQSIDEGSVFLDSVANTDEDMQQLSSDSEEISLNETDKAASSPKENESSVPVTPTTELDVAASTSKMAAARLNQSSKKPIEKRFSLGSCSGNRLRRPILQRHQTISGASSDRVSLIAGQQLKELTSGTGSGTQTTCAMLKTPPLETHFGTVICTSSPPTFPRRAQLLQQYSDPQSQPTHTTTTTEDDTCSTLNTEVFEIKTDIVGTSPNATDETDSYLGPIGLSAGGDGGSTTQTQHSSLNTVVSFGRSSPLLENNNVIIGCHSPTWTAAPIELQCISSSSSHTNKEQLPRSRPADDPCASSISDSAINKRHPIISMPSSLKNFILRGSTTATEKIEPQPSIAIVSRSASNLSYLDASGLEKTFLTLSGGKSPCQVILELPLIKVPTDESSESSSTSEAEGEHSRSKSGDDSRDPSLPGSSRKWSKETLF